MNSIRTLKVAYVKRKNKSLEKKKKVWMAVWPPVSASMEAEVPEQGFPFRGREWPETRGGGGTGGTQEAARDGCSPCALRPPTPSGLCT